MGELLYQYNFYCFVPFVFLVDHLLFLGQLGLFK